MGLLEECKRMCALSNRVLELRGFYGLIISPAARCFGSTLPLRTLRSANLCGDVVVGGKHLRSTAVLVVTCPVVATHAASMVRM